MRERMAGMKKSFADQDFEDYPEEYDLGGYPGADDGDLRGH